MYGRQRQQRGDRHLVGVDGAVAQDQDVVAPLDGVDRLGTQRSQLGFDAFAGPGQRVGHVEHVAAELALRVRGNIAQLGHIGKVQHRLADFKTQRRVDLIDVEQIGFGADEAVEAHHDRLANRVDRRIGHLGEQLLEVVVQRFVFVGQHRQRAVVAHRPDGFFAIGGHRCHQKLDVFLRHAKRLLAVEQRALGFAGAGGFTAALHVIKADAQIFDPLLVGLAVGQAALDLFVVDHATQLQVDHEHLARLQAPFADDFVLWKRQHAGFRRHDDEVIVGHTIARRAQAIAVQRGADLAAVGEDNRGRAIPRLEHGGVVLVKRAATLVHAGVLFPRLGNHHHHRLADRVTGHGEQLQAIVKGGGVRLGGETDRVELLQVSAKHWRAHHAFARFHPVVIALDGVDFAVVRHVTVRVRQRPLREGVGRKTLVHQTQRRHTARVLQVLVIGAHLVGQQQAFIDDGAAAHAGHVILFTVLELERHDVRAGGLANHVELALKGVLHDNVVAAADEKLTNDWLFFTDFGRHRHVTVDRHVAPAQQNLALGLDSALKLLFASLAAGVFLGQKDHPHAVLTGRWQRDALGCHFFAVKRVGQLDQDARAVAHELVRPDRTTVVQVLQYLQRVLDNVMRLDALDVGNKTHAARVVLMGRRIQTVVLEMRDLGSRRHGRSCRNSKETDFTPLQHLCQAN